EPGPRPSILHQIPGSWGNLGDVELVEPDRAGPRAVALLCQHRDAAEGIDERRDREFRPGQAVATLVGADRTAATGVDRDGGIALDDDLVVGELDVVDLRAGAGVIATILQRR